MALLHYPVLNRRGEVIAAALTNLDLHDLARVAATYGVRRLFVATPLDDQRALAERLVAHWTQGFGAGFNPDRGRALGLISIVAGLDEAVAIVAAECGGEEPRLVATAARAVSIPTLGYETLARELNDSARPCLLLFGTASGLVGELLDRVEGVLPAIQGAAGYNHLSVRSAAAVVLDRLLSART